MDFVNVIFNRPIRIGKTIYPRSKRSVSVEADSLKSKFILAKIESGDMTVIQPKAAAPAAAAPVKTK